MAIFRFSFFVCLSLFLVACGDDPIDLSTISGMNRALEANPSDTTARYARARFYLQNGKADSALIDMQTLIKVDSSRTDYFLTLGDIYLVTNRTRYTKQALQKAISLDKSNQEAHMKLAELYLYVEMRQDALNELNEVLRINKNNPKGYYLKGIIYKEGGDTALAISSFLTTTEQDPNYALAYEQLGLIYAAKHDPRCIDFYNNVLKINPSSTQTRYNIGYFYQTHGDLEKAKEVYKEISVKDPKFANAPYNIGFILFEYENKPAEALPYFLQAISINPNYTEAIYMSGLCNEKTGNKELAIKDYQDALKRNPQFDLAIEGLKRLGVNP
jgi:tetratricopeptide (TPR) repeat protein